MQMKIIFVTYCRAMFGANLCMLSMIKDLRERYDVEPMVIVPAVNDGTLEEILKQEQIPYIVSDTKPWVVLESAKLKILRGVKASLLSHKYAKNIARLLGDENYALVYSNNSTIQLGADLAGIMNLPHVWHVREYAKKHYHIDYSYPSFFVKRKFEHTDKVITVSKDLEQYVKRTISPKVNTRAIYDGIEDSGKTVTNHQRLENICHFVCVGVLQEGKNQIELLKAATLLKAAGRDDFHIHFVGNGDEYEKQLRDFCNKENLSELVTFHGYQKDVDSILEHMNVGVICSKSEAFGRVTVEYMLSSLPVIGAAGAGTSEIVEEGKTGLLYQAGDVMGLADCMSRMIDNIHLCDTMGENGYHRAKAEFMVQRNTDEIWKVFQSMI